MVEKPTLLWVDHWKSTFDKPRPYTSDAGTRPASKRPVREEAWYSIPKDDTVELFLSFDLISAIPMERKIKFHFAYQVNKPTGRQYRIFDHQYLLIGIFNVPDGPTPEDLIVSQWTGVLPKTLKRYFQEKLREALKEAIASKLECGQEAVGHLSKIVNRHTTLMAEY